MICPAVVKDAGVIIAPNKYKMSEAKADDSNSPLEDKKGSQKRAKVSMAGAKRKSDKRQLTSILYSASMPNDDSRKG
ncbi:hypothetical protein GOP47_0007566 [Adiantum capillus-veneris]|uniref:Uncharacterized protein n=1 Tax=Adiantum capillus-veneris TaxID=13818 RepID=A0A9D4V2F0_ADICA|nr:hypothetical protein GOP47_0007566 [Adiantum capillus-veneris]